MTPERCPDCGRFAADGENTTPYGSERYLWCSTCMKFVPDQGGKVNRSRQPAENPYGTGDMETAGIEPASCFGRASDALAHARALWECLQLSGADVSSYAEETRTRKGREAGFWEWLRRGSASEVVAAVLELRKDRDIAGWYIDKHKEVHGG